MNFNEIEKKERYEEGVMDGIMIFAAVMTVGVIALVLYANLCA